MLKRYNITLGATTTAGGKVISACTDNTINGVGAAREGDEVQCPKCNSVGIIEIDGPRLSETDNGRELALSDDLCICKCTPPPRLVAIQDYMFQYVDTDYFAAQTAAMVARLSTNAQAELDNAAKDDGVPIRLLHPETREPFKRRPYTLQLGDKAVSGMTDAEGCTRPISAADRASIVSWHVDGVSGT
ncbi:hypothetical protein MasN3_14360 [Massilia varians]|uniref:PAAR domain-containing protein n=1 Tax=Massilia varians TaxID=457921 RepID=A0ABN6T6R1_9BURK|nr:PAAR domain-containing protein [Massilia varians]BDT57942.1 hypothetical protein MasN3_14360 [Massilia varians]